jgi:hypothetical protein
MDDLLTQAIEKIKAGERKTGGNLLLQVLKHNPRDEQAWLWLAAAVEKEDDRRYCLEQALAINPLNEIVQAALEAIKSPKPLVVPDAPAEEVPAVELAEDEPISPAPAIPIAVEAAESAPAAPPRLRLRNLTLLWIGLGLVVMLLVLIVVASGVLATKPAEPPTAALEFLTKQISTLGIRTPYTNNAETRNFKWVDTQQIKLTDKDKSSGIQDRWCIAFKLEYKNPNQNWQAGGSSRALRLVNKVWSFDPALSPNVEIYPAVNAANCAWARK